MRLLFFFLASICISYGESFRGFVINVINGDTITVLEKTPEQKQAYRVRLKGVDAPEKGQYGYSGAKYFLEKLIWGEMVTVQYSGRDKNGIILGLVLYGGTFVNYEMVKEGWAWYDKKYFDSQELERLEASAKKEQKGLWAEENAIPPWEWRKGERGKEPSQDNKKIVTYWISSKGKTHLPGCRYYGVGMGAFNNLGTADYCGLCWKMPKVKVRKSELTYDPFPGPVKTSSSPRRSYSSPRHNSVYHHVFSPSTSTDSKGRIIYTGPRGGRYYINKNGNKTYIKRK